LLQKKTILAVHVLSGWLKRLPCSSFDVKFFFLQYSTGKPFLIFVFIMSFLDVILHFCDVNFFGDRTSPPSNNSFARSEARELVLIQEVTQEWLAKSNGNRTMALAIDMLPRAATVQIIN
jgi:hypothetical protein